jgi:tetratricopeptide (TPR) repeat protein
MTRPRGKAMNRSSYYIFWLAAPMVLGLVSRHPALLLLVGVGLVARRWLPDPYLFFKYARRVRSLRSDIEANPHNASAQRELALIYLDKRRPARALPLLAAALEREPDSAELLYLKGVALLGVGRPQEAVDPLVAAVNREPRLRYGDAYLKAGDALMLVKRFEDAQQAYDRLVEINRSSIEGRVKLGQVRRALGDQPGAKQAFADARTTYRQLPAFKRRRDWIWSVRAWWVA